jgi:hypothetical protein
MGWKNQGSNGADAAAVALPGYQQFAALIAGTLQSGMSATLALQGDSTGVNTTLVDSPTRWFRNLAQRIGAALAGAHVLYKSWDPATQDFGAWGVLQAGAQGQRHALFTGSTGAANRTRLQAPAQVGDFTGDIDFRIHLAMDSWTPASVQTFLARHGGVGSRGWFWRVATNGDVSFTWHASPGTETNTALTATAANVAGVNGAARWLRVTLDLDNGSGGYTVTMYRSTDGVAWTQIAQNVTAAGATTVGNPAGVNYEVGGRGNSTEVMAGKVFEVQLRNGIGGPIQDTQGIENWSSTNANALGGSPTLYVVNGSEAGKGLTYFTDTTRFPKMVIPAVPAVQYLSTSHNEAIPRGLAIWTTLDAWLTQIRARQPMGTLVVCMQNPESSPSTNAGHHNARTREIGAWAMRNNLPVCDLGAGFSRGNVATVMSADGVHPNDAGYDLMAAEAFKPYKAAI